MAKLLKIRSQELMAQFTKFKNKVYQNKPWLMQSNLFQFTVKLNKKGNWVCQCVSEPSEVEIAFCKTSTTLLKRLSYLRGIGILEFAQDSQNVDEFHIAILNSNTGKQKPIKTKHQLQFLF